MFLSQNNKLDVKQSGFRSGHSTETALLSVTEALAKADSKSSVYHLPLLTLSIIRSSCPPSHHWTSLGFHFAGLNPISLVGLSRWPGEGWYPKHINWSLGFPRDLFLDPSSSPRTLHHWVPSYRHMASLQLNLAKTELLVFPATPTLQHDFTIQLGSSTITPSASVRNLGVIFDDQLTFKEHIAKTALQDLQVCTTQHQKDQALSDIACCTTSCPGPCHFQAGLLQCSSGWTSIKPLQMIQNAAARLVFNEPKRAHVTPLFVSLHWLPVAARIQFKTLMLAYRTTTGSAPTYFHSLLQIYIPSRSLRSASERSLVVPSQRGLKSLSRTFSFTVPGWWNDLPTSIRNAGSLSIFNPQLKTHLFEHYST